MSLFSGFAMIIVWFAGGLEVLDGTLKIGTLLAMYSYMWMVYGPLEWLTEVNIWMTRAFAAPSASSKSSTPIQSRTLIRTPWPCPELTAA